MPSKRQKRPVISGIYCIENTVNKKVYVGSSKDIYTRWSQHRHDLKRGIHHNIVLQRAWDKYGESNFSFRILEEVRVEELLDAEQKWYEKLQSSSNEYGYNLSPIARSASYHYDMKDIENGKSVYSKEQFSAVLDYLCNTDISIPEIAKLTGMGERTIYQMYFGKIYTRLTDGLQFRQRKNVSSRKLSEADVLSIIQRLKNRETLTSISNDMNVAIETIKDIKDHKTWKYLTNNEVFLPSTNWSSGSKTVDQYDKNMNYIATYASARDAEAATGVGYRLISQVCHGEKRSAHGFIFRFSDSKMKKTWVGRESSRL